MEIGCYGEGLSRYVFVPFNEAGGGAATLQFRKAYRYNGASLKTQPTRDGEGYNRLRFVLTSPDIIADWELKVYDRFTDTVIHTQTISRSALSEISGFTIGSLFTEYTDYESHYIAIKNVQVRADAYSNVKFLNSAGSPVNELGDITSVIIDYKVVCAAEGKLIIAVYDRNGAIVGIDTVDISTGTTIGSKTLSTAEVSKIKVFAWEKGYTKPILSETYSISK
jgi:hypothetical protein